MKIAILECGLPQAKHIEKFGTYSDMLIRLFHEIDPNIVLDVFQVFKNEYPNDTSMYDAFMLTGSRASVYDKEAWIEKLSDYVRQLHASRKKIIGICFGHQLIAHALGGKTEKSNKGWGLGVHKYQVETQPSWMQPKLAAFSLLVSHQDQVVKLPENAQRLASNEFCSNAAFTLGDHILTFQGHPEFTRDYERAILKDNDNYDEDVKNNAFLSLDDKTDEHTVARWIIRFLTHAPQ